MVVEKVKYIDGREVEHVVKILGSRTRDTLLSEYLDMDKALKQDGNMDMSDLTGMVREGKSLLLFMNDVVEKGLEGLNVDEISGSEKDRIFGEHMSFIMSLGDDPKN
jgi:hypothetical protein